MNIGVNISFLTMFFSGYMPRRPHTHKLLLIMSTDFPLRPLTQIPVLGRGPKKLQEIEAENSHASTPQSLGFTVSGEIQTREAKLGISHYFPCEAVVSATPEVQDHSLTMTPERCPLSRDWDKAAHSCFEVFLGVEEGLG